MPATFPDGPQWAFARTHAVVALRASPHGRDERPAVCPGRFSPGRVRTLRPVTRRTGGVWLIGFVLLLGACGSGGSEPSSSPSSPSSEPSGRAALEVRPITALLPPGDPTVPADADTVVEPASGNGLRYALGPAALSGPIVRRAAAKDLGGNGQSWIVDIRLTPSATRQLEALGRRLADQPPPGNSVAILVDGMMESQTTYDPSSTAFDSIQIAGPLTGKQARDARGVAEPLIGGRFGPLPLVSGPLAHPADSPTVEFVLDAAAVADLVDQPEIAKLVVARHEAGTDRFVVATGARSDARTLALTTKLDADGDGCATAVARDIGAVVVTHDAEVRRLAQEHGVEVWHSRDLLVHVVATS